MVSSLRALLVIAGLCSGCSFDASGSGVGPIAPVADASTTVDASATALDAGAPDAQSGHDGHGGGDEGPGKH